VFKRPWTPWPTKVQGLQAICGFPFNLSFADCFRHFHRSPGPIWLLCCLDRAYVSSPMLSSVVSVRHIPTIANQSALCISFGGSFARPVPPFLPLESYWKLKSSILSEPDFGQVAGGAGGQADGLFFLRVVGLFHQAFLQGFMPGVFQDCDTQVQRDKKLLLAGPWGRLWRWKTGLESVVEGPGWRKWIGPF
jgi:hypothetical protein